MFGVTRTYLDWAAAAPITPAAKAAFIAALGSYGNPGSPHTEGRAAKTILEDARTIIARLAEVKTDGVVFTSGATEANNLAILGSVRAGGAAGAHVLYQAGQHASVIGAVTELAREGAIIEPLDMANIAKQLRPETALVTLDAVNSETGERFDTLSVRRALDKAGAKARLHVDASQLPLAGSYTLAHLGADMVSIDAQKVGAVRGVGVLLVRHGIALSPLMQGGAQEGNRRPGTESVAHAAALAAALAEAEERRERFLKDAAALRVIMTGAVERMKNAVVNEGAKQVPHILNLSLLGRDTDYLVALLDARGFAVSTKSACESDSEEGSRAVLALTGDAERAASTLRISFGSTTTKRQVRECIRALIDSVRFLDEKTL